MAWLRAWLSRQIREVLVVDLRALALMRIGVAVCVLVDLAGRYTDARDLYSDAGMLPRSTVTPPGFWGFRLYFLSGDENWVLLLMAVTAVVALGFLLGFGSRFANVLLWLLVGSLQLRNMLVLQGGDDLLLSYLFWLMFLPTGGRWSLDAHRRSRPVASPVVGLPALALYVQLFLLYFVTGTLKANHPHWWWGDGVYHALSADYFVTPLGRWLYPRWLLLKLLSYTTLLLEISGPFVLLLAPRAPRLRTAMVILFVAFHAGIAASLHVGLFSLVVMVCWLFVLPREAMDKIEGWLPRETSSDAGGPVEREPPSRSARALAWLAGVFIALLLVSGAARDRLPEGPVRNVLTYPTRFLRMQDVWGLFVGPREESGWFVLQARRADGRDVDLLRGGEAASYRRPDSVLALFPNQRWRKMLTRFPKKNMKGRLDQFLGWLCDSQPEGDPGERLLWVRFVYVKHRIGARYARGPDVPTFISQARCRQR